MDGKPSVVFTSDLIKEPPGETWLGSGERLALGSVFSSGAQSPHLFTPHTCLLCLAEGWNDGGPE